MRAAEPGLSARDLRSTPAVVFERLASALKGPGDEGMYRSPGLKAGLGG
jgi:hypothetical protein